MEERSERKAAGDRFSAALAGLFAPESPAPEIPETEAGDEAPRAAEATTDDRVEPRAILEALLFVGNPACEPLTTESAASAMQGVSPAEIDEMVAELNAEYEADGCPYEIVARGSGYLMALRPEFEAVRRQIDGRLRQARLSSAAVEALSLVAYNQPVTADQISRLRGSPSGALLAQLVRRKLLRIEREAESPAQPKYWTTERFLELLGLENLQDLPQQEELEPK